MLPTLNNLLENREMALEDGRFLLKQATYEEVTRGGGGVEGAGKHPAAEYLVPVHPNFRVIALSCPVPPYPGMPVCSMYI